MLTFVEAVSLAGDRRKQNDDAFGFARNRAWVLDGATDLDDKTLMGGASDAAWIAHFANARLHVSASGMRESIRNASAAARDEFEKRVATHPLERWRFPISSLLMVEECDTGVRGVDLGDSRVFAVGADGAAHVSGGPQDAADAETALAARQTDAEKPLLQRSSTIQTLRLMRSDLNREGASWTFCLDPTCADRAREWTFALARPAHVLLMTDGFSALTDRYRAYDPAGLVQAALDRGLQVLGQELRKIENEDAAAAAHPRFKKSDDATALLMRLS